VKLKSPGKGTLRGLAVTGVALAGLTSLVLSQTQALADPGVTYVAVGSDTVQDFENGWASALGGNLIGSFNATNPQDLASMHQVIAPVKTGSFSVANGGPTNQLPPEACSFNRPNGSGEGNTAIRASLAGATGEPSTTTATTTPIIGQAVTLTNGDAGSMPSNLPQKNCIDIARSSSTPKSTNVDATAGALVYIPFAVDGVGAAIGSTAGTIENVAGTGTEATPATNLSALAGVGFSVAGLQAMYKSGDDAVANGVTSGASTCYAPVGTGAPDNASLLPAGVTCSSTVPVDLYVPQNGSGTLSFWESQIMGTTINPWDFQNIQSDGGHTVTDYVNAVVEEHDGTAVTVDPNGVFPFSIAQYISQHNGHNPRFHQAQLLPVNGVAAETAGGALNVAAFPTTLLREVYNVVAWDRVNNTGDGNFDSALAGLLVSTSNTNAAQSLLCSQRSLIGSYGFATMTPSAPSPVGLGGEVGGHYCGQVDQTNLRAFGPTTGF
jgi:hypothetical protein